MRGRGLRELIRRLAGLGAASLAVAATCSAASADTLEWAIVQAYQNNPSLNAQRAALRAADENVRKHCRAIGRSSVSPPPADSIIFAASTKRSINKRFQIPSVTPALVKISVLGNLARPRRRRSTTDSKPPTERAKRKARSRARARHCASPSSRFFLMPLPPI